MAKRRRKRRVTRRRRVSSPARATYRRRKSGKKLTPKNVLIGGVAYGLVREPINNALKNVTGNFGFNLADELVLGTAAWFAAKKGKGIVKDIGLVALGVEAHNLARGGLGGITGMLSGGNNNNSSSTEVI
jgi:hypothetical protein